MSTDEAYLRETRTERTTATTTNTCVGTAVNYDAPTPLSLSLSLFLVTIDTYYRRCMINQSFPRARRSRFLILASILLLLLYRRYFHRLCVHIYRLLKYTATFASSHPVPLCTSAAHLLVEKITSRRCFSHGMTFARDEATPITYIDALDNCSAVNPTVAVCGGSASAIVEFASRFCAASRDGRV